MSTPEALCLNVKHKVSDMDCRKLKELVMNTVSVGTHKVTMKVVYDGTVQHVTRAIRFPTLDAIRDAVNRGVFTGFAGQAGISE